ncbi:oogenesis-related [Cynoglossus semilaevis]|uniref:Oogenesis-related gene n=1 Tax=Cynoglossus semilaevis TaxID=244447 RepID=A0A3P8V2X1_CYNSE|nr:uncharacterized protein LOC103376631 [Cynoglossus semilaevis]
MTMQILIDSVEQQEENTEDRVVRKDGVFRSLLRGLFWPFGLVVRAYRGVWWVLGFRPPREQPAVNAVVSSPERQSLIGRKRLHRVTRLFLAILPRWVQRALGYPVSSSIGRALTPEIRVSPTKPCGKGSKRKQDDLEDEEEDEDHPTWVEALTQELAEDVGPEEDPDYEPSSVETESEEYHSRNNTESDIEVPEKGLVVIEDVNVVIDPFTPAQDSLPGV